MLVKRQCIFRVIATCDKCNRVIQSVNQVSISEVVTDPPKHATRKRNLDTEPGTWPAWQLDQAGATGCADPEGVMACVPAGVGVELHTYTGTFRKPRGMGIYIDAQK